MTDEQRLIFKGALKILCSSHFQQDMRGSTEADAIQKAIEIAHTLLVEAKDMGVE